MGGGTSGEGIHLGDLEGDKVKKLKSGSTTKPDEAGIKKVVQFAHEKLDLVHVKNRVFSDLFFHFLVVGKIELILQESMRGRRSWHTFISCACCATTRNTWRWETCATNTMPL